MVYLLHGFKAKNRLWTGSGQPGRGLQLQELADDLINRGVMQPLIIVMPDGSNAYGGSFYLNSAVTGNWEDFICRDLVGYIDRTYRTIPQAGPGVWPDIPWEATGPFSWVCAIRRSSTAVYALSPACLVFAEHFLKLQRTNLLAVTKLTNREQFPDLEWRDQVIIAAGAAVAPNPKKLPWLCDLPLGEVDGQAGLNDAIWQQWLKSDPYTLLEPLKGNLSRLRLAFDMGEADRMLPQCRLVHQSLDRLGIPHSYEEYQGDHASHLRERLHDRALPFLANVMRTE